MKRSTKNRNEVQESFQVIFIEIGAKLALLVSDAFPIRSQECVCDWYTDGIIRYGHEYTDQILFTYTGIFGDRSIKKSSQHPRFPAACQRIQQQFLFTRYICIHISIPYEIPHIICAIFDCCTINNGPFIRCNATWKRKRFYQSRLDYQHKTKAHTYLFV